MKRKGKFRYFTSIIDSVQCYFIKIYFHILQEFLLCIFSLVTLWSKIIVVKWIRVIRKYKMRKLTFLINRIFKRVKYSLNETLGFCISAWESSGFQSRIKSKSDHILMRGQRIFMDGHEWRLARKRREKRAKRRENNIGRAILKLPRKHSYVG